MQKRHFSTSEKMYEKLAAITEQSADLHSSMTEMSRLEERLKSIIETCGTLVGRLQVGPHEPGKT